MLPSCWAAAAGTGALDWAGALAASACVIGSAAGALSPAAGSDGAEGAAAAASVAGAGTAVGFAELPQLTASRATRVTIM